MAAAAGLIGLSTVVGMAGAQQQAAAQQAAANYNASIKNQQATAAIAQSQEDERRQRIQGRLALGGIRSGVAASGIQMEGSALDVLESSASNAELDALTIRHQGQMKAWAYKAGANLDLMSGQQAEEAGKYAAASTLLRGAAGIAGGGKA